MSRAGLQARWRARNGAVELDWTAPRPRQRWRARLAKLVARLRRRAT